MLYFEIGRYKNPDDILHFLVAAVAEKQFPPETRKTKEILILIKDDFRINPSINSYKSDLIYY